MTPPVALTLECPVCSNLEIRDVGSRVFVASWSSSPLGPHSPGTPSWPASRPISNISPLPSLLATHPHLHSGRFFEYGRALPSCSQPLPAPPAMPIEYHLYISLPDP